MGIISCFENSVDPSQNACRNSKQEDPDQTASSEAVRAWSVLFAKFFFLAGN